MSRHLEAHGPVKIYATEHPDRFRLYWVHDGRPKFRRARGMEQARTLAQEIAGALDRDAPAGPSTFGSLIARYLEVAEPGWGDRYREQRLWASRCHVVPSLGAIKIEELAPRHVSSMLDRLARSGYAKSTIGHVLRLVRDVVKWGTEQGFWAPGANPLAGVRLPARAQGAEVGLRRVPAEEIPTASQVRELVDALGQVRSSYAVMAELAASSGLRWGELIGLRVRDVSPAGIISITRQMRESSDKIVPAPPKTSSGVRRVKISAELTQRVLDLAGEEPSPDALLFTSPRGKVWRRSSFNRRYLVPARDGIDWPPNATWHGLRHHAISSWLHAGMSPADVARMAGHSSPQVTLTIYATSDADWLERVSKFID
jgi:integrase